MSVFNPPHFLRHIGMPTLREFTEAHLLGVHLTLDWTLIEAALPAMVNQAVETLDTELHTREMTLDQRNDLVKALGVWFDDLRRCHLMANPSAVKEFLFKCGKDEEVLTAFGNRDEREKAMWMLTFREEAFRQTELHLAFQAKTNGRFWKKHRIQAGLDPTDDESALNVFSQAVADLYKKTGAGKATHFEVSHREEQIQITLYVEGPMTAWAHFSRDPVSQGHFSRIATRIALETALLYHPQSGTVETIVKGGAKNHTAVLELFGKHLASKELKPEEIKRQCYELNALRDGLEPFEDWARHGIRKVCLRRAKFLPIKGTGVFLTIEAPGSETEPDALAVARARLKIEHAFKDEYNLEGATLLVYPIETEKKTRHDHFSFDVSSSGSSTIKNLPVRNQAIAHEVLRALQVIEAGKPEPALAPVGESDEAALTV